MLDDLTKGLWVDQKYPIKLIDVDDRVFSYREASPPEKGTPVIVVLHGIGSGSGSWAHLLSHFENQYRVLAWDAPGYNCSTPLSENRPGALGYAHALHDFLDAMDVSPKIILGHSLGAMIAGAYVAEFDPSLPILILADPANGYGQATPEVRKEKLNYRLNMIHQLGPDGMAEKRSRNLLSISPPREALELVEWNMRKVTVRGYEQASHALADGDLVGRAMEYHGDVLVLCGSEDSITPVDACQHVAQAYDNSLFKVLPGLGHASYVEGPELFNKVVEDFLETLDA